MAAMTIYGKRNLFKIHLRSQEPVYSIEDESPTPFVQMLLLGWHWLSIRQGQVYPQML